LDICGLRRYLLRFEVAANVGWKALFSTVGNRKRMMIIIALAFFSQWSGNGLVSYYLKDVLDTIGITNPTIQVSTPFSSALKQSTNHYL
jgi:hypothetical protein